MKLTLLFLITIAIVFIIDMLWLGLIAKKLYADNLGHLLRKTDGVMSPIWWAAAMVYLCIALGIVFFVLPKAHGDYMIAITAGVVLGAVIYGVYDFTNYSLVATWPLKITLIDFIWGMVLCGLSSFFTSMIQNRFFS